MSSAGGTTDSTELSSKPHRKAVFVTTHWSVVLCARDMDSPRSGEALEKLCRTYWYPLYSYARWRGYGPQDAEDYTQEFFSRLLQKRYLDNVERERGRFRTFLLTAFKRFLCDEFDRTQALKRGGGSTAIPIDTALAERLFENEPAPDSSADAMFERRWAIALLNETMARLRTEFESAGKAGEFDQLKRFLATGRNDVSHGIVAAELGMSEGALRVAVHRLRKRFRSIFREEIAHTVSSPEDVDAELNHLFSVL